MSAGDSCGQGINRPPFPPAPQIYMPCAWAGKLGRKGGGAIVFLKPVSDSFLKWLWIVDVWCLFYVETVAALSVQLDFKNWLHPRKRSFYPRIGSFPPHTGFLYSWRSVSSSLSLFKKRERDRDRAGKQENGRYDHPRICAFSPRSFLYYFWLYVGIWTFFEKIRGCCGLRIEAVCGLQPDCGCNPPSTGRNAYTLPKTGLAGGVL